MIRRDKRIALCVGARQLTDGAAPPLQFQLGQVAFPSGTGEERRVEAAQRQVDDGGQVGEIPPRCQTPTVSTGNG